jgi:hypothetical protein
LDEDHAPPEVPFELIVVVLPTHIVVALDDKIPASTDDSTVKLIVEDSVAPPQLAELTVYVIVAVPGLTPVTKPLASIVATLLFDDIQLPPGFPLVEIKVVFPTHKV